MIGSVRPVGARCSSELGHGQNSRLAPVAAQPHFQCQDHVRQLLQVTRQRAGLIAMGVPSIDRKRGDPSFFAQTLGRKGSQLALCPAALGRRRHAHHRVGFAFVGQFFGRDHRRQFDRFVGGSMEQGIVSIDMRQQGLCICIEVKRGVGRPIRNLGHPAQDLHVLATDGKGRASRNARDRLHHAVEPAIAHRACIHRRPGFEQVLPVKMAAFVAVRRGHGMGKGQLPLIPKRTQRGQPVMHGIKPVQIGCRILKAGPQDAQIGVTERLQGGKAVHGPTQDDDHKPVVPRRRRKGRRCQKRMRRCGTGQSASALQ